MANDFFKGDENLKDPSFLDVIQRMEYPRSRFMDFFNNFATTPSTPAPKDLTIEDVVKTFNDAQLELAMMPIKPKYAPRQPDPGAQVCVKCGTGTRLISGLCGACEAGYIIEFEKKGREKRELAGGLDYSEWGERIRQERELRKAAAEELAKKRQALMDIINAGSGITGVGLKPKAKPKPKAPVTIEPESYEDPGRIIRFDDEE